MGVLNNQKDIYFVLKPLSRKYDATFKTILTELVPGVRQKRKETATKDVKGKGIAKDDVEEGGIALGGRKRGRGGNVAGETSTSVDKNELYAYINLCKDEIAYTKGFPFQVFHRTPVSVFLGTLNSHAVQQKVVLMGLAVTSDDRSVQSDLDIAEAMHVWQARFINGGGGDGQGPPPAQPAAVPEQAGGQ